MKHFLCGVVFLATLGDSAAAAQPADLGPDPRDVQGIVDKAASYLKSSQGTDGSFSPQRAGPGISAVVASGLLRNGLSSDDPVVAKTLTYLEKNVRQDGGVYDKFLANYTTSVALMAFAEANGN